MTNSSLRSALDCALVLLVLVLAGCGEKDGAEDLKRGWAAYDVRDLKKADRFFARSVSCDAGNVEALVGSALVKLQLGEIKAAKTALAQASELAGADDDVVLLGARIAYYEKDYKTAAKRFGAFAADATRDAAKRAEAYVGLAVVEMTCNEHDSARVALLKAQSLDRRCASARYHLGMLYRNLGYDEAALEQYEAYVMLEKSDAARARRVQSQRIPALRESIARKATERAGVDRRDSAASSDILQKADAEWKKGNFKTAKARYAEALRADPLSYPAALGLAQATEKTDTTAAGRRNVLVCYQTACSLKPGASGTLMKTASLAASLGNVEVAAEAYSRALAANPKNIEAMDGLIRALRKQGGAGTKAAAVWQGYRDMLKPKAK